MNQQYLKSVAMSGLFKYLRKQDYERAWRELNISPHKYHAGQIIYGQDDLVHRAAIVHSGIVKGERLHPEGTSDLAYFYGRGELFAFEGALSGKKTSPLQLTAEGGTTVLFFDVNRLFNSSLEKPLIQGLMELLANDDIKKLYRIEILSKKRLRDRIMVHFQVLASKNDGISFRLNMSREQLAGYLCVNRSALSYELNRMKREGILDFNKRDFRIIK